MTTPYVLIPGRGYAGYGLRVWPASQTAYGTTVMEHGGTYKGATARPDVPGSLVGGRSRCGCGDR
ncbi:MAG: hypothetical protein M3442_09195 [Chloroflexota bacterium]|nr:hypothetical protein [Chloroflexota bacterium]